MARRRHPDKEIEIGTPLVTHRFTLTLDEVSELTDELQGKLLDAGCDDASLWSEGETVFLTFNREAVSLGEAIGSAVTDVTRAGLAVARADFEVESAKLQRRA